MGTGATEQRAAYERLRSAHLHAIRATLEDHVARVEWSRDRLERYRVERLRALLTYARERSPFHAARMDGLDPSSMVVEDLARLPPMLKDDSQREWDAIVTAPGLTRAGAERILAEEEWFSYTASGDQLFSSGGSSGVRGVYVWDWHQLITAAGLAWRMQVREERRSPEATLPARLAVLEAGGPPHASTPLFDVATTADMDTAIIPAGDPFEQVHAAVAEARPTHLVGYASVIARLAHATLDGNLDIHPVRVSTNSEPLSEEDLAAITRAWNAPVHNLWGSTEIGVQAVGCGHGEGLHVCEDEVVLERVDEAGDPVPLDQPAARTLATGLASRTFPFIRYDLGDEVTTLPGECPCGSSLLRIASVAGRRDDDFRYRTDTVPASAFRHVLGTDPAVSEYQVRQTPAGAEVVVVGSPDLAALSAALVESLRRYDLRDPEIKISTVAQIERHPGTGKLKRFVALP
ncbi:MAG: phenylacetate--CoA ligase family protein [Solirubrobacterales bacterium]|nr:phenylacetate--CoA ligase family protein [Solirubrobacterales bacterium]MBV9534163.1 phenylacetate--CoA ligase family protein [Solirubrobacterales bacterium]